MPGRRFVIFVAVLAAACTREDQRWGAVMKAQPLREGPLVLESHGERGTLSVALAFRGADQEAVHLVLASGELGCSDLKIDGSGVGVSGNHGVIDFLRVAPVLVDHETTEKGYGASLLPEKETWRVTDPSTGIVGGFLAASLVDPATAAAAKDRRSTVRVSVTNQSGRSATGSMPVVGCGDVAPTYPRRAAPDLQLRIGAQSIPIRSATYRRRKSGEYALDLRTNGASCKDYDYADVHVGLRPNDFVLDGDRIGTTHAYNGHGFAISAAEGSGETVTVTITGTLVKPAFQSSPRNAREKREYFRHVTLQGRVDALRCPDET